jgi:hypothetical protein
VGNNNNKPYPANIHPIIIFLSEVLIFLKTSFFYDDYFQQPTSIIPIDAIFDPLLYFQCDCFVVFALEGKNIFHIPYLGYSRSFDFLSI